MLKIKDTTGIKEMDIVELDNAGRFYQVEQIQFINIRNKVHLKEPTLVVGYEDCQDSWYSYYTTLEEVEDRITAVYRKIDNQLKLIWDKNTANE